MLPDGLYVHGELVAPLGDAFSYLRKGGCDLCGRDMFNSKRWTTHNMQWSGRMFVACTPCRTVLRHRVTALYGDDDYEKSWVVEEHVISGELDRIPNLVIAKWLAERLAMVTTMKKREAA